MDTTRIKNRLKKWNRVFCAGMACRTNLKRDIAVISTAIFLAGVFLIAGQSGFSPEKSLIKGEEAAPVLTDEQIYLEVHRIQSAADMSDWKSHRSPWFGFAIKYPGNWPAPKSLAGDKSVKWEYKFQFRKNEPSEKGAFSGFDVIVYDLEKSGGLSGTDEFPQSKKVSAESGGECQEVGGRLIETGDYPAEEIYVAPFDDCFVSGLFFSVTSGQYVYNLFPVATGEISQDADPRVEINDHFSEFYSAAASLNLIDIVRPKPAPPKPRINAPKPVVETRRDSQGRMVCAKKNDKPKKSTQNKKRHLDMECCLDPDEYPNPWCYYPPEKYGKYL